MEIETASRRRLLTDNTIRGYVVTGTEEPRAYKYRLKAKVDGTGKHALVLRRNNGWAQPDPVKHAEYPILVVDCYADPTRDVTGMIDATDAEDKAFALYRAVDTVLHGVRDQWWGAVGSNPGLRIITCARFAEPTLITQDDQHRVATLQSAFGGLLGDSVVVHAEYAIQTHH